MKTPRLTAVDALRGVVMVIMALDHTREFIHAGAMVFQPEDLTRTTAVLFLTRWVTHICAPTFVFLAGMGAFLRLQRGGSRADVSRFLWTRGLWLAAFELVVMRLAMNFSLDMKYPVLLLILWALGLSMIAMAGLLYLPVRAIAALAVLLIAGHNALDGVRPAAFGVFAPVWQVLHQPGVFLVHGVPILVGYPVLPWIGVMAAGYCFGRVMSLDADRRRRILTISGLAMAAAFVVVRAIDGYGDPSPWSHQTTTLMTVLSFLRATKYPPSFQFVLMTLGPALILLAWLDRRQLRAEHPLVVIGRVPFFYYVAHFTTIHVVASCLAWLRYGPASLNFLFSPLPSMGGSRDLFPSGFGYPLWVAYVVWIAVVAAMYPPCRWFARIKRERSSVWLSYL